VYTGVYNKLARSTFYLTEVFIQILLYSFDFTEPIWNFILVDILQFSTKFYFVKF